MSIVIFGTRTPYEVPREFVLEKIEALTIALGGKPLSSIGTVPRDDD